MAMPTPISNAAKSRLNKSVEAGGDQEGGAGPARGMPKHASQAMAQYDDAQPGKSPRRRPPPATATYYIDLVSTME
jgi:hypothetical protein